MSQTRSLSSTAWSNESIETLIPPGAECGTRVANSSDYLFHIQSYGKQHTLCRDVMFSQRGFHHFRSRDKLHITLYVNLSSSSVPLLSLCQHCLGFFIYIYIYHAKLSLLECCHQAPSRQGAGVSTDQLVDYEVGISE